MANSATQNPANKVGRNSGAGEGGVSEVVPTQAEANRGVEPLQTGEERGRSGGMFARLGIVTLLGAGVAAFVTQRVRKPKSRMDRLRGFVGHQQDRLGSLSGRKQGRLRSWIGLSK